MASNLDNNKSNAIALQLLKKTIKESENIRKSQTYKLEHINYNLIKTFTQTGIILNYKSWKINLKQFLDKIDLNIKQKH